MDRIKDSVINCPNCGAPITGATCEYCGTLFYDFANIDAEGDSYIRMKIAGQLLIFKARTMSVKIEDRAPEQISFYADSTVYHMIERPEYYVTLEMLIVPDDKGVIMEKRRGTKNDNRI